MEFIKLFNEHSEYESYINSEDKKLPNLSYCEDANDVHLNPLYYVVAKYNITSTSEDTSLMNGLSVNVNKMYIDGIEQSDVVLKYTFNTTGEHNVKYLLTTNTTISEGAFANTPNLTEIKIPNSVTHIGYCAFINCTGLTNVIIPNSVTLITVNGSSPTSMAFFGCSSLTSVTIGDGITYLGDDIFKSCTNLINVKLGKNITTIGNNAFKDCTSLTSITIPNSVINIYNESFLGCTALTRINSDVIGECIIPNGVINLSSAFKGCTGFTKVIIPDSVETIYYSAFYNCSNITNVIIGKGIDKIWNWAFENCTSLVSVTIYAITPPTLNPEEGNNYEEKVFYNNAPGRKIYVPAESVNAYKTAQYWSTYADDIEAIH